MLLDYNVNMFLDKVSRMYRIDRSELEKLKGYKSDALEYKKKRIPKDSSPIQEVQAMSKQRPKIVNQIGVSNPTINAFQNTTIPVRRTTREQIAVPYRPSTYVGVGTNA